MTISRRPRNPYTAPSMKLAWGRGFAGMPLPDLLTDSQYRNAYKEGEAARANIVTKQGNAT